LILDVYVKLNTGLNCVLIISYDIFAISPKLLHLQTFGIQIFISRTVLPLKFYDLTRGFREKIKIGRRLSVEVRKIDKFLYLRDCEGLFKCVCDTLVEFGRIGRIFIEKNDLAEKISNRERVSIEESSHYIKFAVDKRLINEVSIEINNNTFYFISLKPKNLSLEVLNWVLKYLKKEEILSTYKNIKMTLKRVFDLQISKIE
jgi:hypothetical protein